MPRVYFKLLNDTKAVLRVFKENKVGKLTEIYNVAEIHNKHMKISHKMK